MRRLTTCVLTMLALAPVLGARVAVAQTASADQSCGGLLCDMGVFGHKTETAPPPPPAPPVPAANAQAAVASPTLEEPAPTPKKRTVHKKRIAKVVAEPSAPKVAAAPKPVPPPAPKPMPSAAAAAVSPPAQPNPNLMFRPIY